MAIRSALMFLCPRFLSVDSVMSLLLIDRVINCFFSSNEFDLFVSMGQKRLNLRVRTSIDLMYADYLKHS